MEKNFYDDMPLSESNVSLKLADIQKQCSQLLQDTEDSIELTLEDAVIPGDAFNPYDRA